MDLECVGLETGDHGKKKGKMVRMDALSEISGNAEGAVQVLKR